MLHATVTATVTATEGSDHRAALSLLYDEKQELSAAHVQLADAMQAAHLGDEQHSDVEVLWSIADTYKHACLLAQETDLESEAVALSCPGVMLDKVFKRPQGLEQLAFTAYDSAGTAATAGVCHGKGVDESLHSITAAHVLMLNCPGHTRSSSATGEGQVDTGRPWSMALLGLCLGL
eukprot:m51a1_g13389 hypothetical protein (177) ;mRNA; r:1657-2266